MREPIVIVEGVDMCGKTEISRAIDKKLAELGYCAPYFKNEMERKVFGTKNAAEFFTNTLRFGLTYFASYLRQSGNGVVLDRCYPSEWVYSRLFSRATDPACLEECDRNFADMGTKIILTYRTSYKGRQDDTHPELIDSKRLTELDALYREFAKWTKCEVLFLNVDDENLERETRECVDFIRFGKKADDV